MAGNNHGRETAIPSGNSLPRQIPAHYVSSSSFFPGKISEQALEFHGKKEPGTFVPGLPG